MFYFFSQRVAVALDMTGAVNLRQPDVVYTVFEYYGPFGSQPSEDPTKIYFGKLVSMILEINLLFTNFCK